MNGRTRGQTKTKKSFTLAPSSVAYLERLRKERKAPSVSLVLDDLIREAESRRRRDSVEEAISAYYSGLTPDEEEDQSRWGQFALAQLEKDRR